MLYNLCADSTSPAGSRAVGMQMNSSIMQPASRASRRLSFPSSPYRQRRRSFIWNEMRVGMTPGCRGDVNITELINLAAGVANVRTDLKHKSSRRR